MRFRAPSLTVGALLLVVTVASLATGGCAGHWWTEEPRAPGETERPGEEADAQAPSVEPDQVRSDSPEFPMESEPYESVAPDDAQIPLLRVGLAHGIAEVSVSCSGPFSVRLFAEPFRTWRAEGGGSWEFRSVGPGMEGHGVSGSFPSSVGTVRVTPEAEAVLEYEGSRYRGEIEVFASSPGSLAVANVVDLESYLRGVVPKEIGPRSMAELEAVKAQAVAARTYAVASSGKRAGGSFDVLPTVEDQVYAGVDVEDPVSDRAVLETEGVVVLWHGAPISAYFHANCGGRTEARHEVWELPGVSYLRSVWDTPGGSQRLGSAFCFHGANFTWEETWTGDEIARLVRDHLPGTASTPVSGEVTLVRNLKITDRTTSGRIRWLEVETNLGRHRVFGDRVRWLLRRSGSGGILRSAWFELDVDKSGGRVTGATAGGRGYGHGIGMCQHGALEMAREGDSYEDILRHYYSGVELADSYGEPPETD